MHFTIWGMSEAEKRSPSGLHANLKNLLPVNSGSVSTNLLISKQKKTIRFQYIDVPVSSDWQQLSKQVTLHQNTKAARFYVLGINAGKGDTLLVRSLEFERSPAAE